MNNPTSTQLHNSQSHQNLNPNQWINSRLFNLNLVLTLLFTLQLLPSPVVSLDVGYFNHHRVHRQNLLPKINQEQPEPSIDDLTLNNNYDEITQFKMRSDGVSGHGLDRNLLRGYGNNGGYDFGVDDTYSSSLRALDTSNNGNLRALHQQQPLQQLVNHASESADVSSFVQHIPSPSSQLKHSNLNIDSPHPQTIFARASSSARIHSKSDDSIENMLFVGSVIGVTFAGIFLVVATGYFVHRINLQRKAAADIEYPAYGVVGPGASLKEKESQASTAGPAKGTGSGAASTLSPSCDRRLAQSAQMYHYHHQKQQMISSDKVATEGGQHPSTSEADSEEEENEEGDYTVYECPGLASTGEMEVKNPLFQDDITPVSSPSVNTTSNSNNNSNKPEAAGN